MTFADTEDNHRNPAAAIQHGESSHNSEQQLQLKSIQNELKSDQVSVREIEGTVVTAEAGPNTPVSGDHISASVSRASAKEQLKRQLTRSLTGNANQLAAVVVFGGGGGESKRQSILSARSSKQQKKVPPALRRVSSWDGARTDGLLSALNEEDHKHGEVSRGGGLTAIKYSCIISDCPCLPVYKRDEKKKKESLRALVQRQVIQKKKIIPVRIARRKSCECEVCGGAGSSYSTKHIDFDFEPVMTRRSRLAAFFIESCKSATGESFDKKRVDAFKALNTTNMLAFQQIDAAAADQEMSLLKQREAEKDRLKKLRELQLSLQLRIKKKVDIQPSSVSANLISLEAKGTLPKANKIRSYSKLESPKFGGSSIQITGRLFQNRSVLVSFTKILQRSSCCEFRVSTNLTTEQADLPMPQYVQSPKAAAAATSAAVHLKKKLSPYEIPLIPTVTASTTVAWQGRYPQSPSSGGVKNDWVLSNKKLISQLQQQVKDHVEVTPKAITARKVDDFIKMYLRKTQPQTQSQPHNSLERSRGISFQKTTEGSIISHKEERVESSVILNDGTTSRKYDSSIHESRRASEALRRLQMTERKSFKKISSLSGGPFNSWSCSQLVLPSVSRPTKHSSGVQPLPAMKPYNIVKKGQYI